MRTSVTFPRPGQETQDGHEGAYVAALQQANLRRLVQNAGSVRVEAMEVDGRLVPLVINDGDSSDCYLVSSYGHYIRYLREEVRGMTASAITRAWDAALAVMGALCRVTEFNRAVSINNWLLSTSPTVELTAAQLEALTRALVARFPGHALVFRSVDAPDAERRRLFGAGGYQLMVNRPVHWWDPAMFNHLHRGKRENIRRDLRALDKSGIVVADAGLEDFAEIAPLYRKLYIEKHSRLNPMFTEDFFATLLRHPVQRVRVLRWGGRVVGFFTWSLDRGCIIPTIIGYDTTLDSKQLPVYRCIMACLFRMSLDSGRHLFLSTGAALFKRNRGTTERIEYEAIHVSHLSWTRRLPWRMFRRLLELAVTSLDTGQL